MICFYFKKKIDNLELSQSEQAKMLYTILSQNNGQDVMNMTNDGVSISLENNVLESFENSEEIKEHEENKEEDEESEEDEEESDEDEEDEDEDEEDEDEEEENEDEEEENEDEEGGGEEIIKEDVENDTILDKDIELQNKVDELSSTLMGINFKKKNNDLEDVVVELNEGEVVESNEGEVVESNEGEVVESNEEMIKIINSVEDVENSNLEEENIKIVKNETSVDYNKMTVNEIKDLLKKEGKTSLPSKAKKSDLIELLNVSD
jgi:X-linked retinitis pigmentosa GTPase regulator